MDKNSFYYDNTGMINILWFVDKFGHRGNLFPCNFFKQFNGLSNRTVNTIARKADVEILKLTTHGRLYYRYGSVSSVSMNSFVDKINSLIIIGKLQ